MNEEIVNNEVAAAEGVYTLEGRKELVDNDEIAAEAAFHMEGRDKVFKRKTNYDTDNTEIQAQWKKDQDGLFHVW